ncbi:MAG: caspase family protein [Proteobacteria bacterium]|nr:caspase family protein [Pseudomonadota bacterium]MBU1687446.1 caspase family protein [Pseudomonadota bacterium]
MLTLSTGVGYSSDCDTANRLASEAGKIVRTNPAGAETKLSDAVAICPESTALLYNLAVTYYKMGRFPDAQYQLEKAVRMDPQFAKALNALASVILADENGDQARAEELARRAVALEPSNPKFQDTLAKSIINVDDPPVTGQFKPNAVAVVIGNRDYKNSHVPAVDYAANDAAVIRQYLIKTMGFNERNIIYYQNASKMDLSKVFGVSDDYRGELYSRLKQGKSDVFLFYSGHGAPDPNTNQVFLLPTDADPESIKITGFSLDLLYANLAKIGEAKDVQSMTVVFDACFSGLSNSAPVIANASSLGIRPRLPVFSLPNATVITSSSGNQISSWYKEKQHGLFTYFFLKSIKDTVKKGKSLTVGDIRANMLDTSIVNEYAFRLYKREQTPEIVGKLDTVLVEAAK